MKAKDQIALFAIAILYRSSYTNLDLAEELWWIAFYINAPSLLKPHIHLGLIHVPI